MSEQRHTPEPWKVGCDEAMPFTGDMQLIGVTPCGNSFVMASFNHNFPEWSRANAARAEACVNACKGMDDPAKLIAELRDAVKWLVRAEYARKMMHKEPDDRHAWYENIVDALDEAGKLACVQAAMQHYVDGTFAQAVRGGGA